MEYFDTHILPTILRNCALNIIGGKGPIPNLSYLYLSLCCIFPEGQLIKYTGKKQIERYMFLFDGLTIYPFEELCIEHHR